MDEFVFTSIGTFNISSEPTGSRTPVRASDRLITLCTMLSADSFSRRAFKLHFSLCELSKSLRGNRFHTLIKEKCKSTTQCLHRRTGHFSVWHGALKACIKARGGSYALCPCNIGHENSLSGPNKVEPIWTNKQRFSDLTRSKVGDVVCYFRSKK